MILLLITKFTFLGHFIQCSNKKFSCFTLYLISSVEHGTLMNDIFPRGKIVIIWFHHDIKVSLVSIIVKFESIKHSLGLRTHWTYQCADLYITFLILQFGRYPVPLETLTPFWPLFGRREVERAWRTEFCHRALTSGLIRIYRWLDDRFFLILPWNSGLVNLFLPLFPATSDTM